jgi:hypothetical protein
MRFIGVDSNGAMVAPCVQKSARPPRQNADGELDRQRKCMDRAASVKAERVVAEAAASDCRVKVFVLGASTVSSG